MATCAVPPVREMRSWDSTEDHPLRPAHVLKVSWPKAHEHAEGSIAQDVLSASIGLSSSHFAFLSNNQPRLLNGIHARVDLIRLWRPLLRMGCEFRWLELAVEMFSRSTNFTEQSFAEGLRSFLQLVRNCTLLVGQRLRDGTLSEHMELLISLHLTHNLRYYVHPGETALDDIPRGDEVLARLFVLAESLEASNAVGFEGARFLLTTILVLLRHASRPFLEGISRAIGFACRETVEEQSPRLYDLPVKLTMPFLTSTIREKIVSASESLHFLRQAQPNHPLCQRNPNSFSLTLCLNPAEVLSSNAQVQDFFQWLTEATDDSADADEDHAGLILMKPSQLLPILPARTPAEPHRNARKAKQEKWRLEVEAFLRELEEFKEMHRLREAEAALEATRKADAVKAALLALEESEKTRIIHEHEAKMKELEVKTERLAWASARLALSEKRNQVLRMPDAEKFPPTTTTEGTGETPASSPPDEYGREPTAEDAENAAAYDGSGSQLASTDEVFEEKIEATSEPEHSLDGELSTALPSIAAVVQSDHAAIASDTVEYESTEEKALGAGTAMAVSGKELTKTTAKTTSMLFKASTNGSLFSASRTLAPGLGMSHFVDATIGRSITYQCKLILSEALRHLVKRAKFHLELGSIGEVLLLQNGVFSIGLEEAAFRQGSSMNFFGDGHNYSHFGRLNEKVYKGLPESLRKKFVLVPYQQFHALGPRFCPSYEPQAPFNLVITEGHVAQYRRIFDLLYRLRYVQWIVHRQRGEPTLRRFHQEAISFTHGICQYVSQIGLRPWKQLKKHADRMFEEELRGGDESDSSTERQAIEAMTETAQAPSDVTGLKALHTRALDRVCWNCFLQPSQRAVYDALHAVLAVLVQTNSAARSSQAESIGRFLVQVQRMDRADGAVGEQAVLDVLVASMDAGGEFLRKRIVRVASAEARR
ncbi:hypothetical protein DFJ73DRAFT_812739 [Zopfochytrium polystomum]|nr:hypothetical protein DFJ73DRAFT_812739 [Zopfochytrium polystomum]